jgi:uncharacterized membrane protein YfcA
VAGAFLIGLSKTGLPGAGVLAVPIFAAILPARASTGVVLPLLIVGDVVAVAWYRRHAVWPHLVRLLPWALGGVAIGYWAMPFVSDRQFRPLIGGVVLAMLALNAWRQRRPSLTDAIPSRGWFAAVLGLLAGATTMMANAAGPIMTIYLLAMRLPKEAFIGTGAWYFFVVNALKVPLSASLGLIHPASLGLNLMLAPAVLAGSASGILLAGRLPEKAFGALVQLLAIGAAVRLLLP